MQFPQTNPGYPQQFQQMAPPPREPRKFGPISALILSFFLPALYRDVARRWRGIGFWHIVLLVLIVATPIAIRSQMAMNKFVKEDFQPMADTFPTITIQNGNVSIAEQEPYLWKDPKTGEVWLYVDTTGAFDLPEGKDAPMKLSKNQLTVRQDATQSKVYDLKGVQSFSVDKTRFRGWVEKPAAYVWAIMFGLVLIFDVIWHCIQVLIYAVFGLILTLIFSINVSFGGLMRIAAVAITPAMLLAAAEFAANKHFPHSDWAYAAIEIFFVIVGVMANSGAQSTPGGYGGYVAPQYQAAPFPPQPYPAQGGYAPAPPQGYAQPPAPGYPPQYPPAAPPPR